MKLYNSFSISPKVSESLYWLSLSLSGRQQTKQYFNELQETQWFSPKLLEDYQFGKLHSILTHAFETVPYYREIMQSRGLSPQSFRQPEDLKKLPLLQRRTLLQRQNDLVSTTPRFGVFNNFSSGSTGQRAAFKQDFDFECRVRAHQLRTYGWCSSWELGEPFVLIWGSPIYWQMKRWRHSINNFISNRQEINCFQLSSEVVENILKQLTVIQPVLISGYTTALYLIACLAKEKGVRFHQLRAVQPTAEPLHDEMRQVITQGFGVEVFNKYGSRETNIVSHESPQHEGMCIQSENVFVEFLNDQDEWCVPGETGRLVITTLNNLTMPLIRYETSDLAAPLAKRCSTGRGFPMMTEVKGRQQDLLVTPEGGLIHPQLFSNILMRSVAIEWFQVVQDVPETLNIRLYAPRGLTKEEISILKESIHHFTGYPFHIKFELLNQMPCSNTGKFRLCINNVKHNFIPISKG